MKTAAQRITELREERFMTRRELAKKLLISESQLSRIESGKTETVSSDILIGIAKCFNVSTDYILGLTPIKDNTFALSDLHLTEAACMKLARKEIRGDTLSRLMEHKDFGRLIKSADAYLNDANVDGVAFRNDLLRMYAEMARDHADDFEHASDVKQSGSIALAARTGAHELEISDIQNLTMRILKETKALIEEEKKSADPVLCKFADKEFEAKLRAIQEQAYSIKDPEARLDHVIDKTLEAVREQTGVKAFLLNPFKPLFREIIKTAGAPGTAEAEENEEEDCTSSL